MLLFCFGAPFYGTCFFLQHQKHVVKKEIKRQIIAGIDKKELVHLKFSGSELHAELYWEHEKEFEYAGEMYDVVKQKTIGDTIHFWCWPDHQETGLNQMLRKLVNDNFENNPVNKESQEKINNFLKSLYPVESFYWLSFLFQGKQSFSVYISYYTSPFIPNSSPPPEPAGSI